MVYDNNNNTLQIQHNRNKQKARGTDLLNKDLKGQTNFYQFKCFFVGRVLDYFEVLINLFLQDKKTGFFVTKFTFMDMKFGK